MAKSASDLVGKHTLIKEDSSAAAVRSAVQGRNDKVPDSDIQGKKAGERARTDNDRRSTVAPDREGRPSEYPASQVGVSRDSDSE